MRISDWSSDVCSSDLLLDALRQANALIVLASTIANQAMTVKKQYIYPISTQYFRDRTEAEPVNAALLEGRAPDRSFHFQANLVKITPLTVPIAALKNLTYPAPLTQIGRASCRERVCQYV